MLKATYSRIQPYLPAIAFFSGFAWDAFNFGRRITYTDLAVLSGYLLAAASILWWIGRQHHSPGSEKPISALHALSTWERIPFLLLQFLFGSLFSALFILYFKSAGALAALLGSLALAGLLVANEFIHDNYHRFTVTWALFGLCAMLLFNFLLPFLVGSIGMLWFYLSTLAGAVLTHWLRVKTPGCPGYASPVWIIAILLALAYPLDIIPPVPLVKRDVQIGLNLEKSAGDYQLVQEKTPWWEFWRQVSDDIHVPAGARLYCVSSVFAPPGLDTQLYHRWQYRDARHGWLTTSRLGFGLAGGRDGGFRGYTYKQNLQSGVWRVVVETENGHTITIKNFRVVTDAPATSSTLATTIH